MNTKQLISAWFHGTAPKGHASSLSFEGATLRSYNVAIARKHDNDGFKYVVTNGDKHSVTSTRHTNAALRIIPTGMQVLVCSGHFNPTLDL